MGVRITPQQNEKLAITPLNVIINGKEVHLASNTTISDYVTADYVLSQSEEMACTSSTVHSTVKELNGATCTNNAFHTVLVKPSYTAHHTVIILNCVTCS